MRENVHPKGGGEIGGGNWGQWGWLLLLTSFDELKFAISKCDQNGFISTTKYKLAN